MNELEQPQASSGAAISQLVCLVDDDPSVRRSVGRLLESDGFKVLAFSQPQSFLDFAMNNAVAVAVLDIWMDQMTGMELLAHLAARSPRTKNIFITGQDDPTARAMVLKAGAFAFFMKPFDDARFLEAVRGAFAQIVADVE